ncbi:MAG TPA: CHASE2 domain-containing protein [Terriglobia bacterium]|nr:CHASE2 domain-containing protein [Terriglobia bacterium]
MPKARAARRDRRTLTTVLIWIGAYSGLAVLVFFCAWLRFPNFLGGCVDYAERPYYALIDYYSPPLHPDLRVIHIKDFPDGNARLIWRKRHAVLLRALAEAGARVVAFDITFDQASEYDTDFVAAIQDAGKTRIVLGYLPLPTPHNISANLGPALRPDFVELGSVRVASQTADHGKTAPRRLVVLAHGDPGPPVSLEPTFPLQVKLAWERAKRDHAIRALPDLARGQLNLVDAGILVDSVPSEFSIENNDVKHTLRASFFSQRIPPTTLEEASEEYSVVEESINTGQRVNLEKYKDKVVLIGADVAEDRVHPVESSEETYGYAIHAGIINALLSGKYPHHAGIAAQAALLFLLGLSAGVGGAMIPAGARPVPVPFMGKEVQLPLTLIVMIGVYVAAAVELFATAQLILDPVYNVASLIAGYYLSGFLPGGQRVAVTQAKAAASNASSRAGKSGKGRNDAS